MIKKSRRSFKNNAQDRLAIVNMARMKAETPNLAEKDPVDTGIHCDKSMLLVPLLYGP